MPKQFNIPQSPKQQEEKAKREKLAELEVVRGRSSETQKQISERLELKLDMLLERR
jgi:hypothetical protein